MIVEPSARCLAQNESLVSCQYDSYCKDVCLLPLAVHGQRGRCCTDLFYSCKFFVFTLQVASVLSPLQGQPDHQAISVSMF